MRFEHELISNLIHNEEFFRKVGPFIDPLYFSDKAENIIVNEVIAFFTKYNKPVTKNILEIEINNKSALSQKEVDNALELLSNINETNTNIDWLVQRTEKFCKDRAVYNAILESIKIIEGKTSLNENAIPKILQDALGVTFDRSVGHDYIESADTRYDFYHKVEDKVPFDLDMMNRITAGGLSRKTLNVVLAGTNAGKSLFMCHVAASTLLQHKNVLYITLEMAEEKIAERIDANLMNIRIDELRTIDRDSFNSRIEKVSKKTRGKLIIKEYPTASAHSGHFRSLLEELKTKKNFIPDLVIIDYLNICSSSRLKMGSSINSYLYIKSIAEELRGLAIEYNVPILSATQTTRGGFNNSDVELTDTSESFGLPATCDVMVALIRSEELDDLNQVMIKQLKNRYSDPSVYKRFVLGVDRPKMKLYDVEDIAQKDLNDSGTSFNVKPNSGFSDFKF